MAARRSVADPEPLPPVAPLPGDCCGEGCPHCVLELHDAAIERYRTDLMVWKARQLALSQ